MDALLITGGSGCLGASITLQFLEKNPNAHVFSLDMASPSKWFQTQISSQQEAHVSHIKTDVTDKGALFTIFEEIAQKYNPKKIGIIHSAARVLLHWIWDSEDDRINLGGTKNIVECAKHFGIECFVFTCTMDLWCKGESCTDFDDDTPLPALNEYSDPYSLSKRKAEDYVLSSASAKFFPVSLRLAGLFGEHDTFHIPGIMKTRHSPFLVGNPKMRMEHLYVGNAAHAHLQILEHLFDSQMREKIVGQGFLVTDESPRKSFVDFLAPFCQHRYKSDPSKKIYLPYILQYLLLVLFADFCVQLIYYISFRKVKINSVFPNSIVLLNSEMTFRSDKAKRVWGWTPKYSHQEAMDRTMDWASQTDFP